MKNALIVFLVIIIIFLVIVVLNVASPSYFQSNVYLPDFTFYDTSYNEGYFSAEGSWASSVTLADKVSTTQIECLKDNMLCIESNAHMLDDSMVLKVDTYYYDIQEWSQQKIITKPTKAACAQTSIVVDNVKKKVSSVRETTDSTGLCQGVQKAPLIMNLSNGSLRNK